MYISDINGGNLVVYDVLKSTSWIKTSTSMSPKHTTLQLPGQDPVTMRFGITGIALEVEEQEEDVKSADKNREKSNKKDAKSQKAKVSFFP